jgi:hypothetical protein
VDRDGLGRVIVGDSDVSFSGSGTFVQPPIGPTANERVHCAWHLAVRMSKIGTYSVPIPISSYNLVSQRKTT